MENRLKVDRCYRVIIIPRLDIASLTHVLDRAQYFRGESLGNDGEEFSESESEACWLQEMKLLLGSQVVFATQVPRNILL